MTTHWLREGMCFNKSWKLLLLCNVNPKSIWRTPTFSHLFTFWSFFIFSTSFMIDFSTQKKGCTKRNSRSIFPRNFWSFSFWGSKANSRHFPSMTIPSNMRFLKIKLVGKHGVTKRGPWGFVWWNFLETNLCFEKWSSWSNFTSLVLRLNLSQLLLAFQS